MLLSKAWLKQIVDYESSDVKMKFWNIYLKCGYLPAVGALVFIHVICVSGHQERKKLGSFEQVFVTNVWVSDYIQC